MPEDSPPIRKALYASFQQGTSLPGYVRYALEGLCQTGFSVVYLTNERDLDASSHAFLKSHRIELFFTQNRGFDFGMWRRYILYTAKFRRESWERLVLVNDSVVYFQNRFVKVFGEAEENPADVVSLTANDEIAPHLQSFFLYLKKKAIGPFCEFLLSEPEGKDFYDTVNRLEVGTSVFLRNCGMGLSPLICTERPILFSYPELIRHGGGFVKRKLLQKRWTWAEAFHFFNHDASDALLLDYERFIRECGTLDGDFDPRWLSESPKTLFEKARDAVRFRFYKFLWKLSAARRHR